MTMARAALLVLVLALPAPGYSDDLSAEKSADIERLLEMTGALAIGQQMSAAVVGQMTQALRHTRPDMPQRVLDVLADEVNAVIGENLAGLKDLMIPLYHKHFTRSEIEEMIRFYSTGLGQKVIRVMPMLVSESMQAGQQWGQTLSPLIEQRIKARLKSEGYDP